VAVTLTHKTTGGTGTDGTSATTASISLDAGKVILVATYVDKGSAAGSDVQTLTDSGSGATWDEVDVEDFAASNRSRLRLFRAVLASPFTGTLTVNTSSTHGYFGWSVVQCEGAATGSNGADAIVQTVSVDDGGVSAAALTVNLAALSDPANVTFGFMGKISTAVVTAGSGFTELGENNAEQTIQAQWSSTGATACAWSWSGNQRHAGIAIELTEAASAPAAAELVATYTSTVAKTAGAAATATVTAAVGDVLVLAAVADCVGSSGGGTATVGKLDNGTANTATSAARQFCSAFTAASSGTLVSGTIRCHVSGDDAGVKLCVWADNAGAPGALLAVSDEQVISATTEAAYEIAFTGGEQIAIVAGTTYWIGAHHDDPSTFNFVVSRGATANVVKTAQRTYASGPADPFGSSSDQNGPSDIYLTYTEGGGGDALPTGAVTDSAGNTWTRKAFKGSTDAAGTNVEIAIYTCTVTSALNAGTVTLTPHANAAAKPFVVDRFTGITATARGTLDTAAGSSTTPSVTTADPLADDLVYGLVGYEGPAGDTGAVDGDTTGGAWSTHVKHGTTGDTDASNATLVRAWKQVTSTASQTFNPTLGTARDWQALVLVLEPDTEASSTEYPDLHVQGFTPTSDDYTIECDMVIVATSPAQQQRLVWRGEAGTPNGYMVEVRADTDTVKVVRLDSGGTRDEKHSEALAVSAATVVHVKVEATGTAHKAKWWLDAASEPGTWDIEFTDATYSAGYIGVGAAAAAEASMDFDNLEVTLA
jgi:hypothetical protein